MGGSSPAANPQIKFANSQNRLPFFITPNGPAREARFIKKRDGSPDGGVHAIFTIAGRADQPSGCNLTQEGLLESFEYHLPHSHADLRIGFDRGHH